MKRMTTLIFILSLSVIFGYHQLHYENDIFDKSVKRCCNAGQCTYPDLCSSNASIQYDWPTFLFAVDCPPKEYTVTCQQCAYSSYLGAVCRDPVNSCQKPDESCYGWCYVQGIGYTWVIN